MFLVHSVSYRMGEARSIEALRPLDIDRAALDLVGALGFETFRKIDGSAAPVLAACMAETLARAAMAPPTAIDAVVWGSSTQHDEELIYRSLWSNQVKTEEVIALSSGACGQLVPVLRTVERMLARARPGATILVVLFDQAPREDQRLYGEQAVLSDSACCFLATNDPAGPGFAVKSIHSKVFPVFSSLGSDAAKSEIWRRQYLQIRALFDDFYQSEQLTPADVSGLVTNNYILSIIRMFLDVARLDKTKLIRGRVGEYGHCYTADVIITLDDNRGRTAGNLLLLSTGTNNWGLVLGEWRGG